MCCIDRLNPPLIGDIGCCRLNMREGPNRSFAEQDLKGPLNHPDLPLGRGQPDKFAGTTARAKKELVLARLVVGSGGTLCKFLLETYGDRQPRKSGSHIGTEMAAPGSYSAALRWNVVMVHLRLALQ